MARKLKTTPITCSAVGAVEQGGSDIRELQDEMQNWYDGMSENLQGGQKGSDVEQAANDLDECADALESIDFPSWLADTQVTYSIRSKGGRKGDPRWLRRDNAVAAVEAVIDLARSYSENAQGLLEGGPDDCDSFEVEGETLDRDTLEARRDEAETLADELEGAKDTADAVEFPGMYG